MKDEELEQLQGDYMGSPLFSDAEKAAMRWAEVMTEKLYQYQPGRPPANVEAVEELKKHYNDAQIVEISMVSGFFNFWNRFTDALQIDIEDNPVMQTFTKSVAIDPEEYKAFLCECWWNEQSEKEQDTAS